MKSLSAELIAIIATGVALAGLLIVGQGRLEDRLLVHLHRVEDRLLAVEREQVRFGELLESLAPIGRGREPKPFQE